MQLLMFESLEARVRRAVAQAAAAPDAVIGDKRDKLTTRGAARILQAHLDVSDQLDFGLGWCAYLADLILDGHSEREP